MKKITMILYLLLIPILALGQYGMSGYGHGGGAFQVVGDTTSVSKSIGKMYFYTVDNTIYVGNGTYLSQRADFYRLGVKSSLEIDGTVTGGMTVDKIVVSDSGRSEGPWRQKGAFTAGATATPVVISAGGNITLPKTSASSSGIIIKKGVNWLHDYSHPTGQTAIPDGNNILMGGAGNTTMGSTATSTSHGSRNILIGSGVGYPLTTGYGNIAIGDVAFYRATSAYHNVYVGENAGYSQVVNYGNVGVGRYALRLSTGIGCVAVGYGASAAQTTTNYSVAVGWRAGYNTTTGNQNTFIGASPGEGNTTGKELVCVGADAMYMASTGDSSVAIGGQALFNSGSYLNNVAVGSKALRSPNGNYNTSLGAESFNRVTLNSAGIKTFGYTNIDVKADYQSRIYIATHGFGAVGTYFIGLYTEGTSAVTGLTNGNYQWEVTHADSVRCIANITAAGTGTGHSITPLQSFTNTTAIGYNAEPDASNQIRLGNENITEIKTAGSFVGGTTTLGANLTINPTVGSELAPALQDANWTKGSGWGTFSGTLVKDAAGVGTAVPNPALTISANAMYRVSVTVSALSAGDCYVTIGGSVAPHAWLSAATTYNFDVKTITTGNLTFTPTDAASRFTISAVSVKLLTDGTGDIIAGGDIKVNSIQDPNGNTIFALGTGSTSYPGIWLSRGALTPSIKLQGPANSLTLGGATGNITSTGTLYLYTGGGTHIQTGAASNIMPDADGAAGTIGSSTRRYTGGYFKTNLNIGYKAQNPYMLITNSNDYTGADSSLKHYMLAGNPRSSYKATNGDSAVVTIDADTARLISNNPWSIAGGITNTGTLTQKGTATFGSTTNHDPIVISPTAKGTNAFTGTVTTTGDLTANRTYELPDYSGIHWITGTRFMRPYIICATDYTAIDLSDGDTNYILETGLGPITYREEQTKTIRSVVNVATGISIDGDNTVNNEGVEFLFADGAGSGLGDGWIITGTTGATFLVEFTIADISATDQLLVGFRSCVAFDASNDYTNYVEHILLGITATDGSIFASSRVPAIAGGAQQTDDSGTNIADATSHTLQVTINAATRIPTAFLDGVAVTLTNCGGARTTATTMAPMITYLHGAEAADPGIVINRISIYR